MSSKSFALITEGASEHQIIKHILLHYMSEEPDIKQIQPQLLNGKQQNVGGWNEVLKYCEREEDLQAILKLNDFIVIQIDTDQCQIEPYSVSRMENGTVIDTEMLWQRVYDRIMNAIPDTIDKTRVIVAICTETIECWLLPVCCPREGDKRHTNQCLNHLNHELRRLGVATITDKNSNNARSSYAVVLSKMRKARDIKAASEYHYGFSKLLSELDAIDKQE